MSSLGSGSGAVVMDAPDNRIARVMRPLIMPSSAPFATPGAGSGYFTTDAHYLSVTARIVAALRRGSSFVLLTGDPPPNPVVLSRALSNAAAWWYPVIEIACGPELDREQLLRDPAASQESGSLTDAAECQSPLSPLFLFKDADRLSDGQIESIYECLGLKDRVMPSGVLLGSPALLTRLERSNLRLLNEGKTARFRLQQLGREEIETFIRRQLRQEREFRAFTAEAIAAIAETSGGDPALVNNLSRLTLEFAAASDEERCTKLPADMDAAKAPCSETTIAASSKSVGAGVSLLDDHEASPPSRTIIPSDPRMSGRSARAMNAGSLDRVFPSAIAAPGEHQPVSRTVARAHHRRAAWVLRIGILLCLAIGVLAVAVSDGPSSLAQRAGQKIAALRIFDLGAWTAQLRAYLLPRITDHTQPETVEQSMRPEDEDGALVRFLPERRAERETMSPTSPTNPASAAAVEPDGSSVEAAGALRAPTSEEMPTGAVTLTGLPPAPPADIPLDPGTAGSGERAESQPTTSERAAAPTESGLSAAEIAALVARGDSFVAMRDLASARLFYARAVEAGDGDAALRMGATFDPAFLYLAGIRAEPGNQREAFSWYRRARDLGVAAAELKLKNFKAQHN